MDYKYEVLNNLFFFYSMFRSMMLFGWLISMVTSFFVLSIAINTGERKMKRYAIINLLICIFCGISWVLMPRDFVY